jgi:aspartate aminotransferase-like enzyme
MSRPVIFHRSKEFESVFATVEAGLREVFLTSRPVYVFPASGTGCMEAAIRNTPPGRILALVHGEFSERFARIAEACGREVDWLNVPEGEVHDLNTVEDRLRRADYVATTITHSETGTGALTDVRAVAELARRHGAMSLVDSVSGIGGAELCTDAWGLDFVFTASQKALALPPGLAFAVASPEFLERSRTVADRGHYFDITQYEEFAKRNQTPTTTPVSLVYAAEVQLSDIVREGIERRWERHLAMRAMTEGWTERVSGRLGFQISVVAPEGSRSPTVTALTLPSSAASSAVVEGVRNRGFVIGGGQGKLKNTTIRIGHMGDHNVNTLGYCLDVVEDALAEVAGVLRVV